jgi:hypothetical protein
VVFKRERENALLAGDECYSSSVDRVAAGRSDVLTTSFGNQRLEDQIWRARQDDNVNPVDRIWSDNRRSRDDKIPSSLQYTCVLNQFATIRATTHSI